MLGSERLTGALLDRLTHHVHILEMNGERYWLKTSKKKKEAAQAPVEYFHSALDSLLKPLGTSPRGATANIYQAERIVQAMKEPAFPDGDPVRR